MTPPTDPAALLAAIDELRKEQAQLREEMRKNAELTAQNTAATNEIVDLFQAAKGAFRVIGWVGTAVKWVGAVTAAGGGLWYLVTHGFIPPK